MPTNKFVLVGLTALIVGLAVFAFAKPKVITQTLGATPGADNYNECTSQNGVQTCMYKRALATATTTPCSILSPSATSTLAFATLRTSVATSTATTWTLAKATSAYATTTRLGLFSLASGAFGTMSASTTPSGVVTATDDLQVIAPNTWLVWGVAGVIDSARVSINFGGSCQAGFRTI